jgi:hypothetical protein
MPTLSPLRTCGKSSEPLTFSSTGCCPADWREFWRLHGTSWRSLIDLHFEICDRLRASSSWALS